MPALIWNDVTDGCKELREANGKTALGWVRRLRGQWYWFTSESSQMVPASDEQTAKDNVVSSTSMARWLRAA